MLSRVIYRLLSTGQLEVSTREKGVVVLEILIN